SLLRLLGTLREFLIFGLLCLPLNSEIGRDWQLGRCLRGNFRRLAWLASWYDWLRRRHLLGYRTKPCLQRVNRGINRLNGRMRGQKGFEQFGSAVFQFVQ